MHESLGACRSRLAAKRPGDELTALLETDYLLAHCCEQSRGWVLAHLTDPLPDAARSRLLGYQSRFESGDPLAYVLGEQAFMTLDYEVSEDTLIPRADTESVVTWILSQWEADTVLRVADLGTGCGTIALMLAHERPRWAVTATDKSAAALAVCERNAKRLGVTVNCLLGAWYAPLSGAYDLIVSNPPYLSADDPHLVDLSHEPRCALVAKDNGMADLQALILGAPAHLTAGGTLVLEHGVTQGEAVRHCFDPLLWESVRTHPDVAGRDRLTVACLREVS